MSDAFFAGAHAGFAMTTEEIATRLRVDISTVERNLSKAIRKITQAGDLEDFNSVVRLTRLKNAGAPFIRCGSIECRPEKWVFYAGR